MNQEGSRRFLGALAPAVAFAGVWGAHVAYTLGAAPAPEASRWAALPVPLAERLGGYASSGAVWLGYTYALSAAFAVWAALGLFARSRRAALGGLTLSGVLAASACFLTGCCGSPMLAVWVSLLGAAAAPWLGPASALFTTVSLFASWRWLRRGPNASCDAGCACR